MYLWLMTLSVFDILDFSIDSFEFLLMFTFNCSTHSQNEIEDFIKQRFCHGKMIILFQVQCK